jgi:hypothetical protein
MQFGVFMLKNEIKSSWVRISIGKIEKKSDKYTKVVKSMLDDRVYLSQFSMKLRLDTVEFTLSFFESITVPFFRFFYQKLGKKTKT